MAPAEEAPWKQIAFLRHRQEKEQSLLTVAAWPPALNSDPGPMKAD